MYVCIYVCIKYYLKMNDKNYDEMIYKVYHFIVIIIIHFKNKICLCIDLFLYLYLVRFCNHSYT